MRLISPIVSRRVSALIGSNIKISSTSVTDVVNESILGFSVVTVGVFAISGFGKREGFFFERTELFKAMKAIVTQESTVDCVYVSVSTCSIGFVVHYVSCNGYNSVCFHDINFII